MALLTLAFANVISPAPNPQGTWHQFSSAEEVTLMTATPFPSETIEDDLDDPRMVESKAI